MRFRYYIVDTLNCVLLGTDDRTAAEDFSQVEDYYVLDTEIGKQLIDNTNFDIMELSAFIAANNANNKDC